MRSLFALPTTLLALSSLISALPQQSQQTTVQAINPINGLPIVPVSGSVTATASAAKQSSPKDDDDEPTTSASVSEDSDPSPTSTITTPPNLSPTPTNPASATTSDSDSEPTQSSIDPDLVIWTDTAANTIITMTKISTYDGPDPTVGVPPPWGSGQPERPTITVEVTDAAGHTELVPTRSVDTFVVAYTGAAERIGGARAGGGERVWWLLGVVGVGVWGAW
ncbi:uncharacterized protein AB675_6084 [Cyphellophora attinorum]|uniref:Uncharacterized protein n=1 Tax=Cyphellophora attinorum TaxID=1664694 RepID=A0A0N1H6J9_9EURO|nr:uncharacterized protein AB675_6084 [Phialophora attinorum]KPI37004.1 hypothetical protein AB675_6084 [Phialophora attinorum]